MKWATLPKLFTISDPIMMRNFVNHFVSFENEIKYKVS